VSAACCDDVVCEKTPTTKFASIVEKQDLSNSVCVCVCVCDSVSVCLSFALSLFPSPTDVVKCVMFVVLHKLVVIRLNKFLGDLVARMLKVDGDSFAIKSSASASLRVLCSFLSN